MVRLRSIGDTVLATPSLIALREFLPNAQIDILLEDWVAPILKGFDSIDNVLIVSKDMKARLKTAVFLRKEKYDLAINLHGGTTATFLVCASGAKHRIGYSYYNYSFSHNHLLSSSAEFWRREKTHSTEQQLALLGFVGVPIDAPPKTRLSATEDASRSVWKKWDAEIKKQEDFYETKSLESLGGFALFHPVAAFESKRWPTKNFAKIAELLDAKNLRSVAVATKKERKILDDFEKSCKVPVITFDNLTLPEIVAMASEAKIFIGNDSSIAHIAAAVQTPSVVIFGSSNRDHWRPWTDAPNEVVYERMPCQPCAGYVCGEFDKPVCILSVSVEKVVRAIDYVLNPVSARRSPI